MYRNKTIATIALLGSAAAASMGVLFAAGKTVTVKGEVVDLSCYMSHGAHGEKHKDCAVTCIKGGAPMGLLASGGRVYLLMSAMGHKSPQDLLLDKVADTVEVTGTENVQGGIRSLTIETVK